MPAVATSPLHLEQHLEQRHADEEAVTRLAEVRGARVGVDVRGDLIQAWQRVHDDRLQRQRVLLG